MVNTERKEFVVSEVLAAMVYHPDNGGSKTYETLVIFYQTTRSYNSEDSQNSQPWEPQILKEKQIRKKTFMILLTFEPVM